LSRFSIRMVFANFRCCGGLPVAGNNHYTLRTSAASPTQHPFPNEGSHASLSPSWIFEWFPIAHRIIEECAAFHISGWCVPKVPTIATPDEGNPCRVWPKPVEFGPQPFEVFQNPYRRALADMIVFDPSPSLHQRLALCKLLAQAVSDVHVRKPSPAAMQYALCSAYLHPTITKSCGHSTASASQTAIRLNCCFAVS